MFMHTFCKYVFVKSYADKKENYTRENLRMCVASRGIVLFT